MKPTKADKIAAKTWRNSDVRTSWLDKGLETMLDNAYLAGILHERERAAKVAEAMNTYDGSVDHTDIAAKIRSGA